MDKKVFCCVDDFLNNVGEALGTSQSVEISQEMINQFADLTLDRQWIHTDPQKAKKESPFGTTISHGYLVLSLFTHFLDEIIEVKNLQQVLNYGVEKLTFKSAVPVNSKVKMSVLLKAVRDLGGICKATYQCSFEVEGKEDPVIEGTIVFLYYFEEETN